MSDPTNPSDSSSPIESTSSPADLIGQAAPGAPQSKKNVLFVAVIGAIIGSFFLLSALEKPPHNMPPGETHTLRINSSRKLIALGVEKDIDVKFGIPIAQMKEIQQSKEQLKYRKRDVENRVNMYCARCHGRPGADPKVHPCGTFSGHCLPSTHSPKTECIKCHRQDFSKNKKKEKAPIDLPLPDERLFEPHSATPLAKKTSAEIAKDVPKPAPELANQDAGSPSSEKTPEKRLEKQAK
ncbi:MAG: hypothetical protein GY822_22710 [Deltaproteobacteria bacterium]|nr:hypothetical protein [Deltaproteobacteria bacterium]